MFIMPCVALAQTTPRSCDDSRASKPIVTSAYRFQILSGLLSKQSPDLALSELTSSNTGERANYIGGSSHDGDAFSYFQKKSGGTTLVLSSHGPAYGGPHGEGGVIKTIAIGDSSDSLVSVNDPSGVLIGDTRPCVIALAGTPVAQSINELDYVFSSNTRRVYRFDDRGRVEWIGVSFGEAILPSLRSRQLLVRVLAPVSLILFAIFFLGSLRVPAFYTTFFSRFTYEFGDGKLTVTQLLFGQYSLRRLVVPLSKIKWIRRLSAFHRMIIKPWYNYWGNAGFYKPGGVAVRYRHRFWNKTAVFYPEDVDAFIDALRATGGSSAPTY
jgi:hypothetical protein